jgi:hypothetical protein
VQSVGGAFLLLASEPQFNKIGLDWGVWLLDFICMLLILITWFFFQVWREVEGDIES